MSGRMQRPCIFVLHPNTGAPVTVRHGLCGPKLTDINETRSQSHHGGAGEALSRKTKHAKPSLARWIGDIVGSLPAGTC